MIRFWPYLALAVAFSALGAIGMHLFDNGRYQRLERRFIDYQLAAAQALSKAQADAIEKQERQAKQIQLIERTAQDKAQSDEQVIADLRARFDRVRITSHCPSAPRVPEPADPPERARPDPGAILPRADDGIIGSDLIDFARDAERVRTQLIACQAVIRTLP